MIGNDKSNINDYIRILEWYKVASKEDWEIKAAVIHAETKRKIRELALKEIPNIDKEEARKLQKLLKELFLI